MLRQLARSIHIHKLQVVRMMLPVASIWHRLFPPASFVRLSCSALILGFGVPRKLPEISDPSLASQIPYKKWNLKTPCWISHWTSPCSKKIKSRIAKTTTSTVHPPPFVHSNLSTPRLAQFGWLFGFGPPGRKKLWEGLNTTKLRERIGIIRNTMPWDGTFHGYHCFL